MLPPLDRYLCRIRISAMIRPHARAQEGIPELCPSLPALGENPPWQPRGQPPRGGVPLRRRSRERPLLDRTAPGREGLARENLHLVQLVETPLPPFLAQIQTVDFREAGEEEYGRGLQTLWSPRTAESAEPSPAPRRHRDSRPARSRAAGGPALPARLGASARKESPPKRHRLLAPAGRREARRPALHGLRRLGRLVWATAAENPIAAALRIVEALEDNLKEDEPDRVAALAPLREGRATGESPGW